MNFAKFTSLSSLSQAFPTEESCLTYLEQHFWKNGVVSPFDPTSKVYNYGNHKYRCKNTGKNFTVRTNTLFHGSKVSLQKWFMAIWLIANYKKGISSCQLAKEIGVRQATAWHMLHRIRECFFCENNHQLDGEVELDETFVEVLRIRHPYWVCYKEAARLFAVWSKAPPKNILLLRYSERLNVPQSYLPMNGVVMIQSAKYTKERLLTTAKDNMYAVTLTLIQ